MGEQRTGTFQRRRALRYLSIATIVLFGSLFTSILLGIPRGGWGPLLLIPAILLLVLGVGLASAAWRCPSCQRGVGGSRIHPRFCSRCGSSLTPQERVPSAEDLGETTHIQETFARLQGRHLRFSVFARAVSTATVVLGALLLAMGIGRDTFFVFVTFALPLLLVALGGWSVFTFFTWRCPACNVFLGRNQKPRHCVRCGARFAP